jgi:hypothetical protein
MGCPGVSRLELRREAQKHGFVTETAGEVDTDRQPIGIP